MFSQFWRCSFFRLLVPEFLCLEVDARLAFFVVMETTKQLRQRKKEREKKGRKRERIKRKEKKRGRKREGKELKEDRQKEENMLLM